MDKFFRIIAGTAGVLFLVDFVMLTLGRGVNSFTVGIALLYVTLDAIRVAVVGESVTKGDD